MAASTKPLNLCLYCGTYEKLPELHCCESCYKQIVKDPEYHRRMTLKVINVAIQDGERMLADPARYSMTEEAMLNTLTLVNVLKNKREELGR